MLGEFVYQYTVQVIDVFQTKMVDMLKQTGCPEMVVGWYHSHPHFGCWLSSVNINMQQVRKSFFFLAQDSPHHFM